MYALNKDELLNLLRAARAVSERDFVLLLTTFSHGLRVSEALALTPGGIRDGYLDVQRLKGSMRTIQPLVANIDPLLDERTALTAWAAQVQPDGRLFPITRRQAHNVIRKHGKAAGLPEHKLHCHILKHSCGMLAIRSGIENARQYLGHRSLNSTGAYLRVDDQAASAAFAAVAGGQ